MSIFRCYMTDAGGHFRDVVSLEAGSDLEALTQARALPTAHAGFELWSGSRLIHCEPASTGAAIGNQKQAKVSFGAGLKAVRTKLERIAASIGDALPGARSPAVARPKEKRRPRR